MASPDLVAMIAQVRDRPVAGVGAREVLACFGERPATRLKRFLERDEGGEVRGKERPDWDALVKTAMAAGT